MIRITRALHRVKSTRYKIFGKIHKAFGEKVWIGSAVRRTVRVSILNIWRTSGLQVDGTSPIMRRMQQQGFCTRNRGHPLSGITIASNYNPTERGEIWSRWS